MNNYSIYARNMYKLYKFVIKQNIAYIQTQNTRINRNSVIVLNK